MIRFLDKQFQSSGWFPGNILQTFWVYTYNRLKARLVTLAQPYPLWTLSFSENDRSYFHIRLLFHHMFPNHIQICFRQQMQVANQRDLFQNVRHYTLTRYKACSVKRWLTLVVFKREETFLIVTFLCWIVFCLNHTAVKICKFLYEEVENHWNCFTLKSMFGSWEQQTISDLWTECLQI